MSLTFTYSIHAEQRMRLRRISRSQVENAILNPHTVSAGNNGEVVAERVTDMGNTLRVVYAETTDGVVVVSAHVITVIRIAPRRRNTP